MRISKIKLENWRNFRNLDISLPNRVFIVGPNASGKSNFLDALRFLRDLATDGGGLQASVKKRGGISKIRCLAARQYSDIVFEAEIGNGLDEPMWQYRLELNQDKKSRPIIKRERVTHNDKVILDRPSGPDLKDPELLSQTHLEQVSANIEFRDIFSFLKTIKYRHIVPQLIREPDRSIGHHDDPFGGDFLEQMYGVNINTRNARLRRITTTLKIAVPQFDNLDLIRDDKGTVHIEARYSHWRAWAARQREDQFSDGTLRLLGLLWSVLDGPGPLLLEEPELSLHPELLPYIPQLLRRVRHRMKQTRQIILSTHATDLLNGPGIELDEVVLLQPTKNGTEAVQSALINEIKELMKGKIPLGVAIMPRTAPRNAFQLGLYGD